MSRSIGSVKIRLAALPHAAEIEDVAPAQRVEELDQRRLNMPPDQAERANLRLDPGADACSKMP